MRVAQTFPQTPLALARARDEASSLVFSDVEWVWPIGWDLRVCSYKSG